MVISGTVPRSVTHDRYRASRRGVATLRSRVSGHGPRHARGRCAPDGFRPLGHGVSVRSAEPGSTFFILRGVEGQCYAPPPNVSFSLTRTPATMAFAELIVAPTPEPFLAAPRIRRCTFRRVTAVDRRDERTYDVDCLFPDRVLSMPLGDLPSALPICNACTASGIFRADED